MTRKDYVMLADHFHILVDIYSQTSVSVDKNNRMVERLDTLKCLAENIANDLERDNKAFDRDRFLKDCGVE